MVSHTTISNAEIGRMAIRLTATSRRATAVPQGRQSQADRVVRAMVPEVAVESHVVRSVAVKWPVRVAVLVKGPVVAVAAQLSVVVVDPAGVGPACSRCC